MLTLAHNASRRLVAVLVAALLAVGVLAAAPSALAADTVLHFSEVDPRVSADDQWYVQTWVDGPEEDGDVTVTIAGRTVTTQQDAAYPHQYNVTWPVRLPQGSYPVTATFVSASGTYTATTTTTLTVYAPLHYAAPGSTFVWGVDPLRATVFGEGGAVSLSSGASLDPADATKVRFPITDFAKGVGHVQGGGVARLASAKRDVTLSDLQWVRAGDGGSLRANATYRHPGQPVRTERGVVLATAPVIYGAGDPYSFMSSVDLVATAAGARVLAVTTGASVGRLTWRVTLAEKPAPATTRIAVSPTSTTYGRTARVAASVARSGTYASGTVTFRAGSRTLGTVRLSRGAAAVTVPAGIAVGTHAVTASYKADYTPTTASARANLRIVKAGTVTKARLAKKKVTRAQRAKVTVTVAGRGTTIRPTGTVTVFDGKKRVGKATLTVSKRGTVTVKLPRLKKRGKHTLRITYGGSSAFGGSSTRVVLRVR
ncbi:Ig-like domain-containing protein [Mumia sp. DW29H23]|uniref:Ig-like domain-containing protein n=1 Tax=Mumia sp. DW29H23 TaxID=3421241 RepID=UPI003D691243